MFPHISTDKDKWKISKTLPLVVDKVAFEVGYDPFPKAIVAAVQEQGTCHISDSATLAASATIAGVLCRIDKFCGQNRCPKRSEVV